MKPLVYWCRWHEGRLRLFGRDARSVWGEIAFVGGNKRFSYEFASAKMLLDEGNLQRTIFLDEMGVEVQN